MKRSTVRLVMILVMIGISGLVVHPMPLAAQKVFDPSLWFDLRSDGEVDVHFYFFWSKSCPHCQAAHPFIEELPDRYPWLILHDYEISENPESAMLYTEMASAAGAEAMYVPAFIFCGVMESGWDTADTTGAVIGQGLEQCHGWALESFAVAAAEQLQVDSRQKSSVATVADSAAEGQAQPAVQALGSAPQIEAAPMVALPLIGSLKAESLSLPALTLVMAGLDAFNPCAFFVLMFLLSLMVHAQDRKRMLLIGATFVFFSGLIYFVFMTAWLNLFLFVGELQLITLAAGLIAVLIALLNIKDFFWYKQGVSLSIPERAKPGLYQRSRNLLKAGSFAAILTGTVVLALAANSYELLCTSGFPMIYTRMLTLNGLSTGAFYTYLAVYNLIYVIPLLLIVLLFVVRFGQHKLSEAEGRVLKLLSGLMMLFLGGLLIVAPAALNQLWTAIALLLGTLLVTAIIVLIDRQAHPGRYGGSQPA